MEPSEARLMELRRGAVGRQAAEVERLREALAQVAAERDAALGEVERLRAALEDIAHFDDAAMEVARTLHYDMRGRARAALTSESHT